MEFIGWLLGVLFVLFGVAMAVGVLLLLRLLWRAGRRPQPPRPSRWDHYDPTGQGGAGDR